VGRIPWLKIGSHRFEDFIASFKSKPETGAAAEEAGLGPQDIIEEVMGRPAGDVGLTEFREMMKTEGNKVTLGVDRSGKKRTVTLTLRRQI
jgi:C-terminal processing protease CtpA/Prc